jgi:predicted  nucleic acid-binding Zn-ribbon protein
MATNNQIGKSATEFIELSERIESLKDKKKSLQDQLAEVNDQLTQAQDAATVSKNNLKALLNE